MKSYSLFFVPATLLILFNPFCSLLEFAVATKAPPEKPNFVVFMVNGLCSEDIITDEDTATTPSLKKLAEQGIILDAFYTGPDSASTLSYLFCGKNTAAFFKDEVQVFAFLFKLLFIFFVGTHTLCPFFAHIFCIVVTYYCGVHILGTIITRDLSFFSDSFLCLSRLLRLSLINSNMKIITFLDCKKVEAPPTLK
jgi:hypothetical protein